MMTDTRGPVTDAGLHCAWWIMSILLGAVLFFAVKSLETTTLVSRMNSALAASGESRTVTEPLSSFGLTGACSFPQDRFALQGQKGTAIAFNVTDSGITASFVAVYIEKRGIVTVVPLDAASRESSARLSPGLLSLRLTRLAQREMSISRMEENK